VILFNTVLIVAAAGSLPSYDVTINTSLNDVNLATYLQSNTSWDGNTAANFTVTLGSSALLTGTGTTPSTQSGLIIKSSDFPAEGTILIIMNTGSRISGKFGSKGATATTSGGTGGTGSSGGHAVYCNMGTRVSFLNSNGEIWSGGGGGGGGGGPGQCNTYDGGDGSCNFLGSGVNIGTSGSSGSNGSYGQNGSSGNSGTDAPNASDPVSASNCRYAFPGSGGGGGAAGRAIYLDGAASPSLQTTSSPQVLGAIS